MSMSTTLYRLPLSKLEDLDRAALVSDSDLRALESDRYGLDQGLAYPMTRHPDVFAYILKPEGRLRQQHEEVSVGYVTPRKLKERYLDFEKLEPHSIQEDLPEDELATAHLEKSLSSLRQFLGAAVEEGLALLVVHMF